MSPLLLELCFPLLALLCHPSQPIGQILAGHALSVELALHCLPMGYLLLGYMFRFDRPLLLAHEAVLHVKAEGLPTDHSLV